MPKCHLSVCSIKDLSNLCLMFLNEILEVMVVIVIGQILHSVTDPTTKACSSECNSIIANIHVIVS